MSERPRVSVIIPVLNRADELEASLRSIQEQTYPTDQLEIIVADNGSTDDSVARAESLGARVVIEQQAGPAAARNRGFEASIGDLIAFTDSDCVADPEWIARLVNAFDENDALGCCGGLVADADPETPLERYIADNEVMDSEAFRQSSRFSFPFFMAANVAFTRKAFEQAGGFDTLLSPIAAGEDADLCWRVAWGGHELRYVSEAVVTHRHRATLGGFWRQNVRYGIGTTDLFRKHRERFDCKRFIDWARYGLLPRLCWRACVKGWFLGSDARRNARYDFVGLCAFCVGRLRGSLRNRVLFL